MENETTGSVLEFSTPVGDETQRYLSFLVNNFGFTLNLVLQWWLGADWQRSPVLSADNLIMLVLEGNVDYTIGDETKTIGPGEVAMVPAGYTYSGYFHGDCKEVRKISLHFDDHCRYGLSLLPMFASPFFPVNHASYWRKKLAQLCSIFKSSRILGAAYGQGVLVQFLGSLILDGASLSIPRGNVDPRVARAVQTIHDRYSSDLTVEGLAEDSGISTTQFRKIFRKSLGISPRKYLCNHRMKVARNLLETTTLDVKQISYKAGFGYNQYFHGQFKDAFGVTPSQYRSEGRGLGAP